MTMAGSAVIPHDGQKRSPATSRVPQLRHAFTNAPHDPQNRSPGSLSAPHDGHAIARAAPHSRQNRRSVRFSVPQVAQIILPNDEREGCTILNEAAGTLEVLGRIDGEDLSFVTETIVEFLGG